MYIARKGTSIHTLKILLCLCIAGVCNVGQAQEMVSSNMTEVQAAEGVSTLPSAILEALINPYKQEYMADTKAIWLKHEGSELEDEDILRLYPDSLIKLGAKYLRFEDCQQVIVAYVAWASSNHNMGLSYDELAPGQAAVVGLDFPFSVEDSLEPNRRSRQLAIELAYKNKGRGEATVNDFFKQCTALPLEIYIDD